MWGRVSGEAGRPVRRGQAHPADREHVRQHHRRNPGDGGQDEGAWDDQHRPVRDRFTPSIGLLLFIDHRQTFPLVWLTSPPSQGLHGGQQG